MFVSHNYGDKKADIDGHKMKVSLERLIELIKHFHNKNIKIVAEGIETVEELDYMRAYTDVDFFQGYYLGMPK